RFAIWPHSPFASGFSSTQSGVKLRFTSFHDRLPFGVPVGIREIGLPEVYTPLPLLAASRYLPIEIFTDVLPSPETSHATPPRGVMSLKPVTWFAQPLARASATPGDVVFAIVAQLATDGVVRFGSFSANVIEPGRKRTPPTVSSW